MSKFLLLAVFFLVSCVGEEKSTPDTVGSTKRYEPLELNDADYKKVHGICMALAAKEDMLNILISTSAQYTFGYAQKNCDDKKMPAMKNVVTSIQGFNPHYIFQTLDNSYFGFSNVETTSNGIMMDICEEVMRTTSVESPMMTKTGAIWFTTNTASEHCKADGTSSCIHIQRGTATSREMYKIHTNEWMKVETTGSRRGFFTERKLISSANCDGKKNFEKRAALK